MQLFERPEKGERAVLVHLRLNTESQCEELEEFRELVSSAGAQPVSLVTGARKAPDPRYFVGVGKAEEIRASVNEEKAEVVLFDHALSPAQQRNLEQLLECRVLDRTGLILDIFAQRARSFEGKLQVELAQLRYLSSRLVRGWTHLERQKGGIGLRGPGETQLETDRRLIGARIKQLNKRLDKVSNQRQGQRKSRKKSTISTVSLVGYTNAGKSTLFNTLTGSQVNAADQLFATLDPTLRRVKLRDCAPVILADTVGFIRHLPHALVAAFRSTLEETREAGLLLHVVDAHDENRSERIKQVDKVLKEIGADSVRQLEVFNKIDLLANCEPRLDRDEVGRARRVWISAATGAGVELLLAALAEHSVEHASRPSIKGVGARAKLVPGEVSRQRLRLSPTAARLRARLFENGVVVSEDVAENGDWLIDVEVGSAELSQFLCEKGCEIEPNTTVRHGIHA